MSTAPRHIRTEDLSAFIDGRVSASERREISEHLATCAECRTEFAQLRATVRLLNGLQQVSPGRSFQLGMDHDGHYTRRSPIVRLLPVVRSLSVAAIILFIVASGALLLDSPRDDGSIPTGSSIASETGATDGASQGAGESDTSGARAAPDTDSSSSGTLIDRGAAASRGDDPLEDLTTLQETPADQPSGDVVQAGDITASIDGGPGRLMSEYGANVVLGLGVLALVLVAFWTVLMRMSRRTGRSGT